MEKWCFRCDSERSRDAEDCPKCGTPLSDVELRWGLDKDVLLVVLVLLGMAVVGLFCLGDSFPAARTPFQWVAMVIGLAGVFGLAGVLLGMIGMPFVVKGEGLDMLTRQVPSKYPQDCTPGFHLRLTRGFVRLGPTIWKGAMIALVISVVKACV